MTPWNSTKFVYRSDSFVGSSNMQVKYMQVELNQDKWNKEVSK